MIIGQIHSIPIQSASKSTVHYRIRRRQIDELMLITSIAPSDGRENITSRINHTDTLINILGIGGGRTRADRRKRCLRMNSG